MTAPIVGQVYLLAATDDHFIDLAAGRAPAGLHLPTSGVETTEIIEMLRGVALSIRTLIDPAAWMIVDQGEVVGLCSITKAFPAPNTVEIGYGIAQEHRGRGIATGALAVLLSLMRAEPRIGTVIAETSIDNLPSQRVLKKNGFVRTGGRIDPEDGAVIGWQLAIR